MIYRQETIRRQDRLLPEQRAREVLKQTSYATLAMTDIDNRPYCIPISPIFAPEKKAIYIHCAQTGKKVSCLKKNNEVCLSFVGKTRTIAQKFTTEYESVVLRGKAFVVEKDEEKLYALNLLVSKYCPDYSDKSKTYIERSLHRTLVIRIDIDEFSGKCKQEQQTKIEKK